MLCTASDPDSAEKLNTLSAINTRIAEVRQCLDKLPDRRPGEGGGTIGHLQYYGAGLAEDPFRLTLDLEQEWAVDRIFLVPSRITDSTGIISTFGFPAQYIVSGATDASFSDAFIIHDQTDTDAPDTFGYPVEFALKNRTLRYLRVEARKVVSQHPALRAFSLAEIYVFSGDRNVALHKPVDAPRSSSWNHLFNDSFVTDGQTSLGLPEIRISDRAVYGWHAKVHWQPDCSKYVEFQFDPAEKIDEIRLYPVFHPIWPKTADYGFPENFSIESSIDGKNWSQLIDYTTHRLPSPGNNPVVFQLPECKTGRLRIHASRLPESIPGAYIFALSEVEIYENGTNIAPRANIVCSDQHDGPGFSIAALTDGFSSRGKLLPMKEWLSRLALRGRLERELQQLLVQREHQLLTHFRKQKKTVLTLIGCLLIAGSLMFRNYLCRKRRFKRFKQEIAEDLHDDIGSNLAGIAMVCGNIANRHRNIPGLSSTMQEIISTARETSDAMKDIVWMLYPERKTSPGLSDRLREIAERLLVDAQCIFDMSSAVSANQLPLQLLRQFILFYKESISNLARYGQATEVHITVVQQARELILTIHDNGKTMNPQQLPISLMNRARKLHADLTYRTAPPFNRLELHIPNIKSTGVYPHAKN